MRASRVPPAVKHPVRQNIVVRDENKMLRAKIDELMDALRNFTSLPIPINSARRMADARKRIIPDEHVQQARSLVGMTHTHTHTHTHEHTRPVTSARSRKGRR
jgi:hypothetical protein